MTRMTIDEQIAFLTELKANPDAEVECTYLYNTKEIWSEACHCEMPNFMAYRYRIRPKLKTIWCNEYATECQGRYDENTAVAVGRTYAIRTAVRYIEWPEGYELRRIGE